MSGFEGSYMGDSARISAQAIMECKICWHVYDPALGDETRAILPDTPFYDLPEDWGCPECDAPAAQFLVKDDPGSMRAELNAHMHDKVKALVADFQEIYHAKMRDVPIINQALHVEAIGFQPIESGFLGVLISPWFMNLILLPAPDEDWRNLQTGAKELHRFPSGEYEFICHSRELVGGYKVCSLFSPMADFTSQLQAREVAEAVMVELFNAENTEETDQRLDIRAAYETPPEIEAPMVDTAPSSRRDLLRGKFAGEV